MTGIDAGPEGYENWRGAIAGKPRLGVTEWTLYTDNHVTAELRDLGPYDFLNTIAIRTEGHSLPRVVLRVKHHVESAIDWSDDKTWSSTDDSRWHGGWLDDELAALLSLSLGIRIRSGGMTREFKGDKVGDGFGVPREYGHEPVYMPVGPGPDPIPRMTRSVRLDAAADLLASYPNLASEQAIALLRAARAYQIGVWHSRSDLEYTWLKLVSAVEAVADKWWNGTVTPVEHLEGWDPNFVERLRAAGGEELVAHAADLLVGITLSTRKFREFLVQHDPGPPSERPEEAMRVDWEKLSALVGRIYGYRSKALHGGKPFPGPMVLDRGASHMSEKPLGLGASVGSSMWTADDLPMHLYVFEHLARGSILNWWRVAAGMGDLTE